ncbi:dephospho-CoA kinase [Persephonella hydrogeniphila]|uniref:Dephospho-CoA kinase n=1 Tax=Persephonella hydrogeniphila TaxID=198703 RepID=A0A285NIW0_9AQUI|nr:dephospho-CoA kinase [Persephonella hydrogeniphila]SNZ07796.1 dephospho-CoA kinase [Persephonella hydrogeniphila]
MLRVGLTGSIGTGKSTVSQIFKKLGAYVIDADKVVHKLLKREDIKEKIREEFGDVFTEEGEVNRKKLAKIVFNDKEKKKKLEAILHPEVFKEIQKFFDEVEKKDPDAVAIAEIPLLIETGSYKNYDTVVVVYAPEELQIERLVRKGMDREEAIKRIKSQLPIDEKIKYADFVIYNTGNLQQLEKEVKDVFQRLKNISSKH